MTKQTEAQKRAQQKFRESRATIQLVMSPEEREAIKTHAAGQGESVNGFIRRAIREAIAQDEQERVSMEAAQQLADK